MFCLLTEQIIKVAESVDTASIARQAEQLVEKTKDELLLEYKRQLSQSQLRNTIHQCINSNLSDKIELIRIENRHLKTLNKNLRELAISSEAALQNNTLDTRIKILRELVKNWRESVTTLEAANTANDALRQRAEIEALEYRQRLEDI